MLPIVNEMIRRQQNNSFRQQRRKCRDSFNMDNMNESRFIELFRINKDLFEELHRLLRPHLHNPAHRDKVPVRQKILVALRFYATGSYQRCVGGDFNLAVSQTSVHRYIHEVTNAIFDHLTRRFIKFPTSRRQINENKETFMNRFHFPGIIGAIDGTHIAILKPQEQEHNFINRKGFHSLNTQVICDANLRLLSVNSNYPGSTHDAFIWRQSEVRDFLMNEFNNNNLRSTWLIGDSGYPLEPFLLTPYLNPAPESPEANYNMAHMSARNTIERTIGLLKTRFRCILRERVARYEPRFVAKLINVCAVLHNMCIDFDVELDEEMVEVDIPDDFVPHNPQPNMRLFNEGQRIRINVTRNYFNN